MIALIAPVGALLVSVALLLMGNGLQGTLLPIRAEMEDFGALNIGIMGSAYFLGFAGGCLGGPYIVARVGHIRTFTAATALASTVALMHALAILPIGWWLLRAVTGASLAILYMVIESWLNERATNESRGTIMSIYTVINLSMIMVGQMLLTLYPPSSFAPFALASILVSIAAVPVALSSSTAPAPLTSVRLRFLHLFKVSPVGWSGALAVGLANGAFWSLGPVFARDGGLDLNGIALFMSLVVLGGAIGQYPFGKLSDRMDRRRVILICAAGVALTGMVLPMLAQLHPQGLLLGAFLFGLTAMPVYAISVAHMNDHVSADGFVEASTCMLLVYAAGAVVGPMLASALTGSFGFWVLFPYIGGIYVLFIGFVLFRMRVRNAPLADDKSSFVANPGTSPVINVMDPRADPEFNSTPGEGAKEVEPSSKVIEGSSSEPPSDPKRSAP